MTLYLSRLKLSRSPSARALGALLNPEDHGRRLDAHHRLLWAVFTDGPDRQRDFLWRAEGEGVFLTLSARPPQESELFERPEVKPFAPALGQGDRLTFALRANATRTEKKGTVSATGKEQKRHIDLVMDRLNGVTGQSNLPKGERSARPEQRMELAQAAATDWLSGLGARSGFRLIGAEVADYSTVALPGNRNPKKKPQFGILDLSGRLEVADPALFLDCVMQGFGRAKSYGCGLMLIRRA
ncbi:type I-E CRISPR-associated protein Cas6/Cse3/CasE [Gemmobacter aquarius]|uniref:Type I-E CRISPR-associated protein Cas6/Cse3/CasE n=1 Tax=Paragemmobacter aquarius TaxID=2169400 RepID=A0A2S0UN07_9RHOB|nr:type I-E CRISPR-associated protein Cas6/Cse3/CasE [Gemmobacter aquarius]AWB49183.1 type I-E CRISPR-associated protein Cas6/Cse3/CasE [Gemmobacter aquarius]